MRKNNAADLHGPPPQGSRPLPEITLPSEPTLRKHQHPFQTTGRQGERKKNHCQTCRSRNVCPYSRKMNDNSLEGPPLQTHEDHEANCVVLLLPLPA